MGAELSVVCWGDNVIGSVEIVPARDFYDYEAKYGNAGTVYHVPPRLPSDRIEAAEAMARAEKAKADQERAGRDGVFMTEQHPHESQ